MKISILFHLRKPISPLKISQKFNYNIVFANNKYSYYRINLLGCTIVIEAEFYCVDKGHLKVAEIHSEINRTLVFNIHYSMAFVHSSFRFFASQHTTILLLWYQQIIGRAAGVWQWVGVAFYSPHNLTSFTPPPLTRFPPGLAHPF